MHRTTERQKDRVDNDDDEAVVPRNIWEFVVALLQTSKPRTILAANTRFAYTADESLLFLDERPRSRCGGRRSYLKSGNRYDVTKLERN